MIFRHPNDPGFKSHYLNEHSEQHQNLEWTTEANGQLRDSEEVWQQRYEHEKKLIINESNITGESYVLELGSGPGYLGQLIINETGCNYTFVDKIGAKQLFDEREYKGKFIVQNMMDEIDVTPLTDKYDVIIANDFLEHVSNPGNIIRNLHRHTPDHTLFSISVPNWRMGHDWIYRGLFDFDNFVYFMYTHGWEGVSVSSSPLVTPDYPKIETESGMPDGLRRSWNWYFTFKKND
jgi:2-polyprenyl-3-methyl-5-hydroxy-6-metoxy-1,4-benzoquinol methylase